MFEKAVKELLDKPSRKYIDVSRRYGFPVDRLREEVKRRRKAKKLAARAKQARPATPQKSKAQHAADWLYRNPYELPQIAAERFDITPRAVWGELQKRTEAACEWLAGLGVNRVERAAIRYRVRADRVRDAWRRQYEAKWGTRG